MKQKRILSLFLALLLVFQLAPAAMAAPEDGAETGPAITGIEIIRAAGSANITLNAGEEAALLIAAVYTRDLQLQETKAAEVSPGEGTVLLTFSESFRDGPVYIKAMLVDPETYAPLCEARTEYTESQATTVDDFDPALVMNFDERKDENFAVLAQGVVPLYAGTDFGRFETEDEVSFTVYGISDAALRRLGPDVKAVLFDGDNSYPVSVDSVERFTGGAVLRGAEPDTEEGENLDLAAFFDYITFDQEIEELDTSEMEYADGVEPAESPQLMEGGDTDVTIPYLVGFQLATDIKTFHIEGTVNVDVNIHFIFRFSKDEAGRPHWFYDLTVSPRVRLDVQLQARLNNDVDAKDFDDDFQIFLGKIPIPLSISGARFVLSFSFPILVQLDGGFKVKTGLTGNWRMTGYDTMEPEITYNAVPDDPDVKLEVGASLDLGFRFRVAFEILKLFYVEGVAQIGRKFRGVLADDLKGGSSGVLHQCEVCIDGTDTVYFNFWAEAGGKLLFIDIVLFHLGPEDPIPLVKKDFYISRYRGNWTMEYDKKCPNRVYEVNVNLKDTSNGGAVNGEVSVTGNSQNGDFQGPVYDGGKMYLPAGNYNISANAGGYSGSGTDYEVKAPGTTNVFLTPPRDGTDPGTVEGIIGKKYRFRYSDGHLVVYEDITVFDHEAILAEVQSGRMIYNTDLYDFQHGTLVTGNHFTALYHPDGDFFSNNEPYYSLETENSSAKIYTSEIRSIDFRVDFPDNMVMYIPPSPNLESITYSGAVKNHWESFKGCPNLTEVNGLERFTGIGDYAFQQTGLREVYLPDSNGIGRGAFQDCKDLTSATLGAGAVGQGAFEGCDNLRQVDFGRVDFLRENAFRNCVSLESLYLPDTLTGGAGYSAFEGCRSLKSVRLPGGVWYGSNLFKDCTSLREVEMTQGSMSESNLGKIYGGMFYNCSSLEHMEIPSGIGIIESEAFAKCLSLESVSIPRTVWKMERDAFAYCPSLREIYFEGTLFDWSIVRMNSDSPVTYPVLVHCADGDTVVTSRG